MKKFLAFALSCSLALTALAGCSSTPPSSAAPETGSPEASAPAAESGDKVVRIGVFEPSTGDSGPGGKQEMLGMQYANTETPTVDIGGETYTVQLVYADNGSDSAKAPTAAADLVAQDVALVLGSYGSGVSMAGGPVFDEAGLAAIGVTCTNPGVTAGNDYYFRICFLDNFQAQVLVNFAEEQFSAKKAYRVSWAMSTIRASSATSSRPSPARWSRTPSPPTPPTSPPTSTRPWPRAVTSSSAPCPSPTPPRS